MAGATRVRSRARARQVTRHGRTAAIYAALVSICLLVNVPFIWMILSALKPVTELHFDPIRWLPESPTLINYSNVLENQDFIGAFGNSLIATFGTVGLCLSLAIPAAYGFARFRFPGRSKLMYSVLFVQFFPIIVFVVPFYLMYSRVGLVDTLQALIISHTVYALPLSVWMLTGAFRSVPREVEEAAEVDGASTLDVLRVIILPVCMPAVAATTVYVWIQAWQEFLISQTLSTSMQSRLLPVQISFFMGTESTDWSGLMAASVIVSLPVLVLFPFLSRHFTAGLSAGAVKG
ncbi:MAG: carbohydrate ABC transporter permease [Chloroflexota bacterium]